jgi:hypothetical protein
MIGLIEKVICENRDFRQLALRQEELADRSRFPIMEKT